MQHKHLQLDIESANRMRREGNRSRVNQGLLFMLLAQIFEAYHSSPVKPPVTLFLLFSNIYVHLYPNVHVFGYNLYSVQNNCLHPKKIYNAIWSVNDSKLNGLFSSGVRGINRLLSSVGISFNKQSLFTNHSIPINRLFLSAFIHADDTHLYYNMLSLLWKGINLERTIGSFEYVIMVCFSLFVSHILVVFVAYHLYNTFELDEYNSGYNVCAVGFSAVLFSLKYIWNQQQGEFHSTNVYGLSINTKYACWAELFLISMISPNASFLGHLCGIVAGLLYVWLRSIYLKLISRLRFTAYNRNYSL